MSKGIYVHPLTPRLAPTECPTIRDIIWAAGFYEGEGTCGHNGGHSCQVGITQKDAWTLRRMQALFGGGVGEQGRRGCFQWHISGARARGFLMTIYGLLSPRRQAQIRAALDGIPASMIR